MVAGLSSTIFAPLSAALLDPLGWRGNYVTLAAVLAVVTVPLYLFGLRGPWPDVLEDTASARGEHGSGASGEHVDPPQRVAGSGPFLLLAAAVSLGGFTAFAVVVNQVPLLIERGLSTSVAAWALGLGGVGQILGRLAYAPLAPGPRYAAARW